jgi:hypothetical protein
MGRKSGSEAKKFMWRIGTWYNDRPDDIKYFKTLRQASIYYGMTYSQLAELGPNGRTLYRHRIKDDYDFRVDKINNLKSGKRFCKDGTIWTENIELGNYEINKSADNCITENEN